MDAPDSHGSTSGRLSLRGALALIRMFNQLEREGEERLPPDFRRPPGKWIDTGKSPRAGRLTTTASHHELKRVVETVRDDDDPEPALCAWLDWRQDHEGTERVAVLVGSHLLGFLDEADSQAMRDQARQHNKRGTAAWADAFFTLEDGHYVVDVNLP
jgi:hypothetical protein